MDRRQCLPGSRRGFPQRGPPAIQLALPASYTGQKPGDPVAEGGESLVRGPVLPVTDTAMPRSCRPSTITRTRLSSRWLHRSGMWHAEKRPATLESCFRNSRVLEFFFLNLFLTDAELGAVVDF